MGACISEYRVLEPLAQSLDHMLTGRDDKREGEGVSTLLLRSVVQPAAEIVSIYDLEKDRVVLETDLSCSVLSTVLAA